MLIADAAPPPPLKGLNKNELYSTSNSGRQYLLELIDFEGVVFAPETILM